ncbi:MAG: hypothetical protein M3O70_17130, partial [Actinomycetota bacterium]|nr:hypothetical protein [Actinomycetota bacterium]
STEVAYHEQVQAAAECAEAELGPLDRKLAVGAALAATAAAALAATVAITVTRRRSEMSTEGPPGTRCCDGRGLHPGESRGPSRK